MNNNNNNEGRKVLVATPLNTVEMRPIVYLDSPVWQASAFHLLVGRKNAGKGTFLAHRRLVLPRRTR